MAVSNCRGESGGDSGDPASQRLPDRTTSSNTEHSRHCAKATQAARKGQNLPPGPERSEAMKKADGLRHVGDNRLCRPAYNRVTARCYLATALLPRPNDGLF